MQFKDYLESDTLLYNYQFGFRRQHSTHLAVTFFTDRVCRVIDSGQLTGSVFIDLRKAFNTVDHSCLLEKLKTVSVHSQEHVWFPDYLFNCHQTIVYENCQSESFPVFCGDPQGTILGLLLFLVYISSLHQCLENSNVLMLTQDMNNIGNWLDKNKLMINLKKGKTESMLFGTGQHLCKEHDNPFSAKIRQLF